MSAKTFYVVSPDDYGVTRVWQRNYGCRLVTSIKQADIVILTGGVDVNPEMYGEARLAGTQLPNKVRDQRETEAYYEAISLGKNVFGVCRGAQLIHVLNGNKLYQHVDNHVSRGHMVKDLVTGEEVHVSSCHHQMMRVDTHPQGNEPFDVIAVASVSTYRRFPGGTLKPSKSSVTDVNNVKLFTDDIEVIHYTRVNSICYQGHPEFGNPTCTAYAKRLQQRYGFLDPDPEEGSVPRLPMPTDAIIAARLEDRMPVMHGY